MEIKNGAVKIGVHDEDGFCAHSYTLEIPTSVYNDRYINDHGYEFVKWNGDLYVANPMMFMFEFEKVRSIKQIDRAFNPDRDRFEMWMEA